MIALPSNVTRVLPGESIDLADGRTLAPAPAEALVITDGDWVHAVTVRPVDYATQARDADGYPLRVFESEFDPAEHGELSDPQPRDDDEGQWDLARQHALDFLLRVEAER